MLQATGWPAVVTVMANWFGKGKYVLYSTICGYSSIFINCTGPYIMHWSLMHFRQKMINRRPSISCLTLFSVANVLRNYVCMLFAF